MTKKEIEDRIKELKFDYAFLQKEFDKMEAFGREIEPSEKLLVQMEEELTRLRKLLAELG